MSVANPLEISAVLAFGKSAFDKSNYAPLEWNGVIARRTLKTIMGDGAMRVFVAKKDGVICGLLIGMIDAIPFSAGLCATDLFFAAEAGGEKLLDAFLGWCKRKNVRRIDMAVSQSSNDEKISRLYKRKGFERTGSVFMQQEV